MPSPGNSLMISKESNDHLSTVRKQLANTFWFQSRISKSSILLQNENNVKFITCPSLNSWISFILQYRALSATYSRSFRRLHMDFQELHGSNISAKNILCFPISLSRKPLSQPATLLINTLWHSNSCSNTWKKPPQELNAYSILLWCFNLSLLGHNYHNFFKLRWWLYSNSDRK